MASARVSDCHSDVGWLHQVPAIDAARVAIDDGAAVVPTS